MNNYALLFPGGGTQYLGMGKMLYNQFSIAKKLFDEANDILGYDLKKLCFEGSLSDLSMMQNSQPAIFLTSVASFKVYQSEFDLNPQLIAGHSLGEYSALVCAGIMDFEQTIRLVKIRGELLQEAGVKNDGRMIAVSKIQADALEEACLTIRKKGGNAYIAVYNSPLQHVISAGAKDINILVSMLENKGAEVDILNISTPSHCPLMSEAAEKFRETLTGVKFGDFKYEVISNLNAKPYTSNDNLIQVLYDHMIKPVKWNESIDYIYKQGIKYCIDVGPQSILKNLVKFINGHLTAFSFDIKDDVDAMKILFKKPDYLGVMQKCLATVASTKNYNTSAGDFNSKIIQHYKRLKEIKENAEISKASKSNAAEAFKILSSLLEYKKLSADEKECRLKEILESTNTLELL